jgi:uncharacterized PurR-regulated membrane protein YhhQ (DUF165 family)
MKKLYDHISPEEWEKVRIAQQCKINLAQPKSFVGYPFIIAIMAVLQVMTVIYDDKFFVFFGLNASLGWLILMPINLYLFQIVAECYGWQYARQIVWCNFIVNLLMMLIIFTFKYVPFSSNLNRADIQSAFITFMDNDKLLDMPPMLISMLVSDLVTSALMAWSKFHWNGRHIIARVLCLHFISEIIILSSGFIASPLTGYTLLETWYGTKELFIARTIIMIVLLPVARLVIYWLQNKVEGVVVFDYKRDVKVFSFRVNNNDTAQFYAKDWNELPVKSKKVFNIERAVLLYHSTHGHGMRIY